MDELLILLGAGASMPHISGVYHLTQHLLQWSRYREPSKGWLRRRENEAKSPADRDYYDEMLNIVPYDSDTRKGIFVAIDEVLKSGPMKPDTVNFEELIHMAELLSDYYPLTHPNRVGPLFGHFISPRKGFEHWNINTLYGAAVRDASMEILNKISSDCDKLDLAKLPIIPGLSMLSGEAALRIFSLNYDDIPFNTGIDFYTGYERHETHDGVEFSRFYPTYPWPSGKHTLCQLHGSVFFGSHPNAEDETVRFRDRSSAKTQRERYLSSGRSRKVADGSKVIELPLITGLRKADKILTRPYGAYYHVLREELLRCNKWLIVGYGFSDDHINQAIQQARRNWAMRGDTDFRAAIIDYCNCANPPPVAGGLGFPMADHIIRKWGHMFPNDINEFFTGPVLFDDLVKQDALNELGTKLAMFFNGTDQAFSAPYLEKLIQFLEI